MKNKPKTYGIIEEKACENAKSKKHYFDDKDGRWINKSGEKEFPKKFKFKKAELIFNSLTNFN